MATGEIRTLVLADGVEVTDGADTAPAYRYEVLDSSTWTGSVTTHTYDVSDGVTDARKLIWRLKDVTGNYLDTGAEFDHPTAITNVRVTVGIALPAGTYYLVGV